MQRIHVRVSRVRFRDESISVEYGEIPCQEAKFALDLLERFGLVNGTIGGEDSAGRAVVRHASVEETVKRAFDLAEAAFAEARARDWLVPVPLPLIEVEAEVEREAG